MKEEYIGQFRSLTLADLADVISETLSATVSVGQRLALLAQQLHPGDVSYLQFDLTSLLLTAVPPALLHRTSRTAEPLILSPRHLGHLGTVRLVEDYDAKNNSILHVCFASPVEAALALLVAVFYLLRQ